MCSSSKINEACGTQRTENETSEVGPTEMEIQEWNMELRTNNVCIDEYTSDVRMEKVKDLENVEAQRREDRDTINQERERINEERDRMNGERHRTNIEKEQMKIKREFK